MSFQKVKRDSCFVGGRHRSATTKIVGDTTCNGNKVLIGHCSLYYGKKSKTVSDKTIVAEGLGDFFKIQGKKGFNLSENLAKNILKGLCKMEQTLVLHLHLKTQKRLKSSLPEVINYQRSQSEG